MPSLQLSPQQRLECKVRPTVSPNDDEHPAFVKSPSIYGAGIAEAGLIIKCKY